MQRTVARYFDRQLVEILHQLGAGAKSAQDPIDRLLAYNITMDANALLQEALGVLTGAIDWDKQSEELQRVLSPVQQAAYTAGAAAAQEAYRLTGVQQPGMSRYLTERGAQRVKQITETTRKELARALAEGMAAGDGRNALIARVQEAMPGTQAGRASVIAGNEIHIAIQSGNYEMLKAAGYRTKTWMTAGDSDVRSTHAPLNGVTIPMDARFANGLLYPGDPSGPPGETIGCRCDLVAGDPLPDPQGHQPSSDYLRIDGETAANRPTADAIREELERIPTAHTGIVEGAVDHIEIVTDRPSSYHRKTGVLRVLEDPEPGEILHEVAHVLETELDLYNNPEFLRVLEDGIDWGEAINTIEDAEFGGQVIELLGPHLKFVSDYQRRIYEGDMYGGDRIDYANMRLNPKILGEYFSEGYKTYILNPKLLETKDPALYNYINTLGEDRSHG